MLNANNTLLHYTNMSATIKILESGALIPSNVSKLNDIFDWLQEQPILVDISTAEKKDYYCNQLAQYVFNNKNKIDRSKLKHLPTRIDKQNAIKKSEKIEKSYHFQILKKISTINT